MSKWNENIKIIESTLEEQEKVVDLVQSTKMYHVLEGVHSLRGKNPTYENRVKQIIASLKHIGASCIIQI